MKRVNEHKPAIERSFDAGFQMPVGRAVGLFDLFLGEMETFQSAPAMK